MSATPSKTYQGGCHCQRNRYVATLSPPLEDGHALINCNCSICNTNGYLLAFVDDKPETFKWEKGGFEDGLKAYTFNKKTLTHWFCPECGTSIAGAAGGKVGINIRTVDDVDVDKLTLKKYDGKNI